MLVICKVCKKKNERDSSFKVVINNKNQYYCNEKEYLDDIIEKKAKADVYDICMEVLDKTTNTILFKELTEISNIHTYVKILGYLTDNLPQINGFMSKNFNSEYGKIKYFTTIIRNNIKDYIVEIKVERNVVVETTEVNYKKKDKKKSLAQYLDEYEEG